MVSYRCSHQLLSRYCLSDDALKNAKIISLFFFRLSEFFYPLLARLNIGAGVEQPFGCLIVQNHQAV